MLELQLLGPPALLKRPDERLDSVVAGAKRLALLAYLATARPSGFHNREALVELLWTDVDRERARATLRSTLRALRRMLGAGVVVNRGDDEVRIDPEMLQCDVWVFESDCARGDHCAALDRYRGDLLPGFHLRNAPEFESWLAGERLRLRELATAAACALSHRRQAAGDHKSALSTARRGLALDPCDEPLVRLTMELLDGQGDRTGALRAYQELDTLLRREYDVEPSPETRALRDNLARRPRRRTVEPVGSPTSRLPDWPVVPPRAGCLPHAEARRCYEEGRFFWSKRSRTALKRAVECFTESTNHDPGYAQGYAGLADAYQSQAAYGHESSAEALAKATAAAEAALARNHGLVDAHTSIAGVLALKGQSARADASYRRALRLNPLYVPALHWYATFLRQRGETKKAYEHCRRAMEIDPLSAVVTFTAGTILRSERKYDATIDLCRRATELDPSYAPAWYFLACTYAHLGRADEALACASRSIFLGGETSLYLGGLGYVLARTGQRSAALRTLDTLEQPDSEPAWCSARALVYIGLSETHLAVDSLQRAYAFGRPVHREPLTDPLFDSLRSDARFEHLLMVNGFRSFAPGG